MSAWVPPTGPPPDEPTLRAPDAKSRSRGSTWLALFGFVMMATSCLPLLVLYGRARGFGSGATAGRELDDPLFWFCVGLWVLSWLVPLVLAQKRHAGRHREIRRDPR